MQRARGPWCWRITAIGRGCSSCGDRADQCACWLDHDLLQSQVAPPSDRCDRQHQGPWTLLHRFLRDPHAFAW